MTESYRRQPTQKALPLTDWPRTDRQAWLAAQAKAGVLDEGGMVSHLSVCTLEDLTRRYAYLLSFLTKQGRLNPHELAASAVTEENILLYVRYLEPRVSSVTLAQSLYKISRVAACLAPKRDWRWLKRVARRLDLRAKPHDKRHEVVEISALFELGLQLMNEAEEADTSAPLRRALLYRDGLIIALRSQPAPPRQHYGAQDWQDLGQGRDDLEHRDPRRGDQGASLAPRRASRLECSLHRSICAPLPSIVAQRRDNQPALAWPKRSAA